MIKTQDILDAMVVDVPEGEQNGWRIHRVHPTDSEIAMATMKDPRARNPGKEFTVLDHGSWKIWMSDSRAEKIDHIAPVRAAEKLNAVKARVNGLGLGMITQALLICVPTLELVEVVEISEDVISLVAPHYQQKFGDRFQVIQGDALTINQGRDWDIVWHDIWPSICGDHWETMKILHRRYAHRTQWQSSWNREEIKRLYRNGY